MDKKLRIDGMKPDARPGSRWMRAFIEDCYDILAINPHPNPERQYAKEFAKRVMDSTRAPDSADEGRK